MKVFIAVDSSEIAEKTCKWYFENLHKDGNEVIIGHYAEQPKLPTVSFEKLGSFPADEISKIMKDHNKKMQDIEFTFTAIASKHKNSKVVVQTSTHSAGRAVIDAAESFGSEMVVIGSRGLGVIKRKFLGSVSDYVLHHSNIPVTICPL